MEVEITIPTIKGIKLRDYQRFLNVLEFEKNKNLLQTNMIEILCGVDRKVISNIKDKSIKDICDSLKEELEIKPDLVKTFKLGGLDFGFITNLQDMSIQEYIDIETNINSFDTIHKAMCVLYRPITKKKRSLVNSKEEQYILEEYDGKQLYSDLMRHIPLDVTFGVYFYFIGLREELLRSTINYLEKKISKLDKNNINYNKLVNLLLEFRKSQLILNDDIPVIILKQILDMLKLTEHYNVSENIEIAKGKYERPTTFKKLTKQIKRWILTKN